MENKKIALITGSNRGIGFETALQLGQQGVTVIITARDLELAKTAAAKLTDAGIDAHWFQLDVTSGHDRKLVAAFIAEKFGLLDILVNNAGVAPEDSLFVNKTIETDQDEFEYIYQTNFFSIVHLTRELLPLLKKSSAGRIVNLSSILGSMTIQAQDQSPLENFRILSYNSAKAALNMFTILLAAELDGSNIKVNSAHPGWVQTPLGGNEQAPMTIAEGAKTSVELSLVDADGPSGKFIHLGAELPW
jgi:NAD(P)-dependent dehydrogenase (short-subunit alcohol dehydrogenase family)